MSGSAITVRRQILDVEVLGDEGDGLRLQRRLPGVCAAVVSPALEDGLAHLDSDGERISIDRIEIDLGELALGDLERELADAVRRGLDRYLRDHPIRPLAREAPAGGDARSAEQDALGDALVHFLRTGRLPWSLRLPAGEDLEHAVLTAWRDGEGAPAASASLWRRLADVLEQPAARTRVVLQFTPRFAVALMRALSPHVATVGGDILTALGDAPVAASARRAFSLRVWDAALLAAAHGDRPSEADLVGRAAASVQLAVDDPRSLAAVLAERWPEAASELRDRASTRPLAAATAGSAGSGDEEEADGLLVEEAGLVLLHPYLERFLAGVGVADGDRLVDPHRAVCLLHHLATGERTAPEHRVTLAKVLCGVPVEEPVPADPGLADAELDEATALLGAVVRNWGALGGASPDALREGFLQRDGVLSGDAWGDRVLRVEGRSLDILLDDLPWGLSVVALPWMERRLIVEWG